MELTVQNLLKHFSAPISSRSACQDGLNDFITEANKMLWSEHAKNLDKYVSDLKVPSYNFSKEAQTEEKQIPTRHFDDEGFLHSETGPAIQFGECPTTGRGGKGVLTEHVPKYWVHGKAMASEEEWRAHLVAENMHQAIDGSSFVVGGPDGERRKRFASEIL